MPAPPSPDRCRLGRLPARGPTSDRSGAPLRLTPTTLTTPETDAPRSRVLAVGGALVATALLAALAGFAVAPRSRPVAVMPEPATDNGPRTDWPQLERVVRGYYDAREPREKLPFVRDAAQLEPEIVRHHALHGDEPPVAEFLRSTCEVFPGQGGSVIHGLTTDATGATRQFTAREFGGRMLLDWRATTGAGPVEWEDFLAYPPEEPVPMRVLAAPNDFYPDPAVTEENWQCLRIQGLDPTHSAWAYYRRTGKTSAQLPRLLPAEALHPRRLTLALRRLGTHPNCYEITAVVSESWVE